MYIVFRIMYCVYPSILFIMSRQKLLFIEGHNIIRKKNNRLPERGAVPHKKIK